MKRNRGETEHFSNVDAAWLRIDVPTNMAIITGVMIFGDQLNMERLRGTIEYRLLKYDRFRQRVREGDRYFDAPSWEFDPAFDIDNHVHSYRLRNPADLIALQSFASHLMSKPMDSSKPLWEIHVVENFMESSALVVRLHHCIADGLALVQVLLSMADDEPDAPWPSPPDDGVVRKSTRLGKFLLLPLNLVTKSLRYSERVLSASLDFMDDPGIIKKLAWQGVDNLTALAKLLLIGPDQKTVLRGQCGVEKIATWSEPIPLDDVKAVGKSIDGTVNDVLLAAMTGGIRRYLEHRGQEIDFLDIRAVIPVSIRSTNELEKLGNRFGLVFLSLPVGLINPIDRLNVLKLRMDAIKDSREALVAYGILNAAGISPRQVENIIVDLFGKKASTVMTNVPGPRKMLYFAGSPLRNMMFWVPQPGGLSLGISILSYNGEVLVGVASDADVIPDPEEIIKGFHSEFYAMKSLVPTSSIMENS